MNREQWIKTHKLCPTCKSNSISQTLMEVTEIDGHYHDDKNTALCKGCGWSGKVAQLLPETEELNATQKEPMKIALRTIDHEENSYVCIKDLAVTVENFNQNICAQLKDDSVKRYTANLLAEINNMLATVDVQHWAGKHNLKVADTVPNIEKPPADAIS